MSTMRQGNLCIRLSSIHTANLGDHMVTLLLSSYVINIYGLIQYKRLPRFSRASWYEKMRGNQHSMNKSIRGRFLELILSSPTQSGTRCKWVTSPKHTFISALLRIPEQWQNPEKPYNQDLQWGKSDLLWIGSETHNNQSCDLCNDRWWTACFNRSREKLALIRHRGSQSRTAGIL